MVGPPVCVGYTISVNTESTNFDLKETLHIIQQTAPHAVLQDTKQGTTTLALQTIEHKGFAEMFKKLEEESERLGIKSFGVSVATMTDAYIKINNLWVPHDADEDQHRETGSQVKAPEEPKPFIAVLADEGHEAHNLGAEGARSSHSTECFADCPAADTTGRELCSPPQMGEARWLLSTPNKTTHKPQQLAMPPPCSPVLERMERPVIVRLRALFRKRALYWTRSPLTIILGWIIPVVLFYLSCFGFGLPKSHRSNSAASAGLPETVELRSSVHFGAARCFVEEAAAPNKFSQNFEALAVSEGATIDKLKKAKIQLLEFARKDFVKYYTYYAYGVSSNATTIEGWYNPASSVSANVLLNLINTALLRTLSNSPKARITATAPFYRIKAPSDVETSEDGKPSSSSVAVFWILLPQAILGLTVSTMAVFPVTEKTCGALELQLMTGVSGPLYVCSHFLFDLLAQYLLPFGASFTMYAFGYETDMSFIGFVALYLVLLSFAPVAIFWPYLLSTVLQTQGAAFTATLALFVIGGPVAWVLYFLALVKFSSRRLVRAAFMLVSPPFALAQAAITAVMEGKIGYFCAKQSEKKSRAWASAVTKQNLRRAARVQTFFQADGDMTDDQEDPCSVSFFSMSEHSAMPDILLLVVEDLVLFVFLSLLYSGYGLNLRKIIDSGLRLLS
ncbi:hypothetical protein HPB52_023644 [Rhipicephalus sanguineus]|uniref:ABC transporter n=1 Tax=Rhipicephalus sanguineus TaxID=34632 RepID=A0A9D4T0I2_RHISA|nr:hypothetical protein HPB52_023644 [Rhipicephalus sanguineus]